MTKDIPRLLAPAYFGSLSGHAHGSIAFTRYRDIDDDMKQELVRELE